MKVKSVLFTVIFTAAFIFLIGPAIITAQTYSGQAYAVRVTETVVGQPVLSTAIADTGDLPNAGGNINLTSVGVSLLGGAVSVGDSTTSTSGSGSISQSAASIQNINIGVLTNTISAGVVSSATNATCPGEVLVGNSSVTNLQINGVGVTVLGTPNQVVQILLGGNPVGTLIINEEIISARSITRNALHLSVQDPVTLTTTEVIVSSSRSGINCAIAPLVDLYSGRGTGVRVTEDDILSGHITTLISDTGPLPTPGGTISTTTTGAGLAGLLTTGVVTANTAGGMPVATSQSSASVDDLGVVLLGSNVATITADVLQSNTQCSCSLTVGSCSGGSTVTGLAVTVLGLPVVINITGAPNQIVNIPVLGFGSITLVINEQFGSPNGNPADFNVNALRINTNLAGLVSTQIVTASSHSDIVCSAAPTSANASVSGRVTDGFNGGIARAVITATDSEGNVRSATANSFGHYMIEGLRSGETYIVEARAKGHTFLPITISLDDDIAGIDFIPTAIGKR